MRSLLCLLAVVGCSKPGSTTRGQRGIASFAYHASPGCEDGCDLERNYVASDGARQALTVGGADFARVGSSAPTIATFAKTARGVDVITGLPGDVDLQLFDAKGGEIDRVTLHVAAVKDFEFMRGWSGAGVIILEGVPITMSPITKRDAGVRILLGADAIRFSVSGTLTSLGPPPSDPAAPASIIETVIVQGTPGAAGLHGVNGAVSLDLPVTVVNSDALTKVTAVTAAPYRGAGGATVDTPVSWSVSTPEGFVFGATCTWSVSDPSVFVEDLVPATRLELPPSGSVVFKMSRAGSFTATCNVGRLMVTLPLKRDS